MSAASDRRTETTTPAVPPLRSTWRSAAAGTGAAACDASAPAQRRQQGHPRLPPEIARADDAVLLAQRRQQGHPRLPRSALSMGLADKRLPAAAAQRPTRPIGSALALAPATAASVRFR